MKSRRLDPLPANPPLAYKDEKFLDSDEARPVRILAEYLEPLQTLCRENRRHPLVSTIRSFFAEDFAGPPVLLDRAILQLDDRVGDDVTYIQASPEK